MPLVSSVRWVGLSKMAYNLKSDIPRFMAKYVKDKYTQPLLDKVMGAYRANLAGPQRPAGLLPDGRAPVSLPVGVRSGDLAKGARMRWINQWAGEVTNDAPHTTWIEVGTKTMAPRHPLGDAVDQARAEVPGKLNDVMVTITREAHN